MKIIVDTSVWSLALRRKKQAPTSHIKKLESILAHGERIFLIGVILQEILQGIKNPKQFNKVYEHLSHIPRIETKRDDYAFAAQLFTKCRSKGVSASTIDFLIAALAIKRECYLLTSDKDFEQIAKYTDLILL